MEDDGTHIFCSNCGKELSKYYKYCPECGVRIVYDTNIDDFRPLFRTTSEIRLNWATVLLGVFGSFSLLMSVFMLFFTDNVVDVFRILIGPDKWGELIKTLGVTPLDMKLSLQSVGTCQAITGLFSLISMYLCVHRIHFIWAFAFAIASSFTILMGVLFVPRVASVSMWTISMIQFAAGLLVSAAVYTSRDQFPDMWLM